MKKNLLAAAIALIQFSLSIFCGEPSRSLAIYESSITVYGDRLPLEEREVTLTPAPIIIITRDDIEKSGARTVQQLLENLPGVTGHDLTGNPVERVIDLRGFPEGTSVSVFLDGIRLNNIDDNSVRWDIVPIEMIERIEVYSGALAPLYGGGAIGGVVNIVTKKGSGIPRLDLALGLGSFGEVKEKLNVSGSLGKWDLYSGFSIGCADGYRENDGYRLDDAMVNLTYKLKDDESLTFLIKYEGGAISAPGALTEEELNEDRTQSPFNQYDGTRGRHRLVSASYHKTFDENFSLSVEGFARKHDRDTLTTGRYMSGFFTKGEEDLSGGVFQLDGRKPCGKGLFEWAFSGEAAGGGLDAAGWFTDFYGSKLSKASDTSTKQNTKGGYGRMGLTFSKVRVDTGYRMDEAKYDYKDIFTPTNNTKRTFRERTSRTSISFLKSGSESFFAAFSEGYKIPSVIELFAYPGFYSNPDLKPTRVNDYEIGYKYFGEKLKANVTIYKMFLRDETVYVLTDPIHFIGQNMNVGKSKREGIEGRLEFYLPNNFALSFGGNVRNCEVTAGPYADNDIPMVPKESFNLALQWGYGDRFSAGGNLYYAGAQYLNNDLTNDREKLSSYLVSSLNGRYKNGPVAVELQINNLFDKKYSTRGVTNGFTDYYVPAYPFNARILVTYSW
jgi:iron complex outermembrane recepter protein